jgi:hypothetical protein
MASFVRLKLLTLSLALLLIACISVAGCAVHLISDYDNVLDQDVTALQQSTETFLNQMVSAVGTPAAAYKVNAEFYMNTDASLRTMATRAASQPKSKIIVGEVTALQNTFNDMQQLHQLNGVNGLSLANIKNIRSALESEFTSILTLELALKSNSTVPSNAMAPTTTK